MRPGADFHFIAGFDHYRAGRAADARREWKACLGLDGTHDFCEFALSVLDARSPKAEAADERPVTEGSDGGGGLERAAQQSYLEGVIHYQKGDYEKARAAWIRAASLAPKGSDAASNARAGLEKLDALYATQAPQDLKSAPEKKDEHLALETYFTGLIHYQKGDFAKARTEWKRARALAPKGSSVETDAKAALEKLDKDEASTRRDGKK